MEFLFQVVLPRCLCAFLLGAVPFAWLVVRLCKSIDLRTVGSGDGVIFETSLSSLTEEQSSVLLHFGNGKTQKWTLLRQASPENVH